MNCPVGNIYCMCQYCEVKCNHGLNCSDCLREGKAVHDIYLCTGFKGDLDRYIRESATLRPLE